MKIIYFIFPIITIFEKLIIDLRPYFCRHQMRYWDMKWIVTDRKSHIYKFDGKVWSDSFCQCQKCGVKYYKVYKVKLWGEWEKSDFTPTKTNVIEVEIFEFGKMSKSQKRDKLLSELLN